MVEIEEVSDEHAAEEVQVPLQVPVQVPVIFMRCNGECVKRMAGASGQQAARTADELVLAVVGHHVPFQLISLVTWTQLDLTSADALKSNEAFAVLLEGAQFHITPLSTGTAYEQQCGVQNRANVEWQRAGVAQRMGTREDIWGLANRISLGGSYEPPMPPQMDDPDADDSTLPDLRQGSRAKIVGLGGRVELNGQHVKLLHFEADKQRWAVQLIQGRERILVRPVNLKLAHVVDAGMVDGQDEGACTPDLRREHRLPDEYDEDPPSEPDGQDEESDSEALDNVPDSPLDALGREADGGIAAMQMSDSEPSVLV